VNKEANSKAGQHQDENGLFEVRYLEPMEGAGVPRNGTGWYWRPLTGGSPEGPFDTSEAAWRSATDLSFAHNHR